MRHRITQTSGFVENVLFGTKKRSNLFVFFLLRLVSLQIFDGKQFDFTDQSLLHYVIDQTSHIVSKANNQKETRYLESGFL